MSAHLTMGVTSPTLLSSSLLWSFSRSWIGSSKIGLLQARSRATSKNKARARGRWSFSSHLHYLSPFSRPLRSHRCKQAIVATGGGREMHDAG